MNLLRKKPPQPLQPAAEMELLRLCARLALGQEVQEAICRQVEVGIEWARARALAHHHRVLPVFYRSLFSICPEEVPFEVLARLRQDYQANAARNLHLTQELMKVLDLLDSRGIEAVPFKGPALAEQYYGDIALRQFDDLDVLIREQHVRQARDLLMGVGFKPVVDSIRAGDPWVLREEGEYNFYDPSDQFKLEVHWQAVPRTFLFRFAMGPLWDRARPAHLCGAQVLSLSTVDTLLVLAIHGLSHAWGRLSWVCDMGQLMRKEEVDWKEAFRLAEGVGAERILRLALMTAERWLAIGFPDEAVPLMGHDEDTPMIMDGIEEGVFAGDLPIVSPVDRQMLRLWAAPGLKEKLRYPLDLLTSPSLADRELAHLPRKLGLLSRLLRPLRAVAELGIRPLVAWLVGSQAGGPPHLPD